MPRFGRRAVLANVFMGASLSLAGCSSLSGIDDPDATTTTEDTVASTPTGSDEGPTRTPVGSNLETECITSAFSGYVGTTPIPPPEKPAELESAAIDYAGAYERYYQRYLALYEIGPPTPERDDLPAHGFPDVRLEGLETDVVTETADGYVVRLAFSRFFEDEFRGEYTVKYYVSADYTIRAEVKGNEYPGPDPLASGKIMSC